MNEGAIDGKFDGADGTFECVSAGCNIVTDEDGKLMSVGGTWHFTPADGAKVDVPDTDFLSYGFWLKTTTKDGVVTYNEVAPFTMAADGMTATTGTVNGSASYKGSAVGVYVHNVLTAGGGMVESRTAGHFTAAAELTANFAGGAVAMDDHNSITGTINKFMLAGEEGNDWSVALKGDIDPTTFVIMEGGTANGGGTPGDLTGQFYGGGGDENETPGAMTGEFNANFSNGSVAGGFGARKQ